MSKLENEARTKSRPKGSRTKPRALSRPGAGAAPRAAQAELPLRIVVESPIPGVLLRMQKGRDELVEPSQSTASATSFDFTVRVGPPRQGGAPNLLGPFVQGPPDGRFVYVNSGARAGQKDTQWDRRAKIPLTDITSSQIQAVLAEPGARLEVAFAGRGRDGGPTCASVRLPPGAWRVRRGGRRT